MTSPKVQYAYANGSANHIRPTLLTYPSGRELNYNYGSADSLPDAASRLAALLDDDGSTHLADYSYLGRGMFIETDYAQPEVKYTLVGTAGGDDPDTGDIYRGLDRFGRIKDSYWRDYGSSADVDRIKYGYDRNGNRTYRENPVATANSASFDEKYFHDLLDRLKHTDRGRLNAQKDGVTGKTFAQCWSLDATGNWRKFTEDSNGDGVWNLDQLRTSNKVNEITDLSEYTGPSWVTPAYNRAGNMTTIPKPADPTASFTATYDAWNRLVKLEDTSGTVAQYEYDGAKRRTVKKSYSGGVLSETRHFYYTEPAKWQVVEERVDSETDPDRQFVWGARYIDDLVLRDRDTDSDGDLDERLFALQDANWNVTGIVSSSGDVQERYSYSTYGQSTALTASFGYRGDSSVDWETAYSGYRADLGQALYVVRHRVFNVATGNWIQRDPHGAYISGDLYAYGFGNPGFATDPLGLLPLLLPPNSSPFPPFDADATAASATVTMCSVEKTRILTRTRRTILPNDCSRKPFNQRPALCAHVIVMPDDRGNCPADFQRVEDKIVTRGSTEVIEKCLQCLAADECSPGSCTACFNEITEPTPYRDPRPGRPAIVILKGSRVWRCKCYVDQKK